MVLLTLGGPQASMPSVVTRAAAWHLIKTRPPCLLQLWSVVRSDKSPEFFKVQKAQFQQWNIFTGRETRKRMQLPCFWNLVLQYHSRYPYVTVPSASMLSSIASFCSRLFSARGLLGA